MIRKTAFVVAVLVAAAFTFAAPNDGYKRLDGEIESVDRALRTIVFRQKSGEKFTIRMPLSQVFHVYANGSMEDLKSGVDVKVYGRVQPKLESVKNVGHICVMPMANTGTNKKTRIDGKLLVEGDKYFLEYRDRKVPIELRKGIRVQCVYNVGFDFLEPGVRLFGSPLDYMTTGYRRQEWTPVNEIRIAEPRERVQAYYAKKGETADRK